MRIINYVFYISYRRFKKEDSTVYSAVLHISMIEYLLLCAIFLLFNAFFFPNINLFQEIFDFSDNTNIKIFAIISCIGLVIINYLYYRKKVLLIEQKYKDCYYNKWVKAWMFFVVDLLIMAIAILIFKVRHHYNI